jgi:hypothetical protein
MTRTGPADAVLPAGRHAAAGRPVLTRPGPRDARGLAPIRFAPAWFNAACFGTAWSSTVQPASGVPAVVRAVFPGEGPFKPVSGRLAARPRRRCPADLLPRPWPAGAPRPPCAGSPPHPLYLYLLKRPAVALSRCLFDPGRDMLCILTSPPRWLQWP